MPRISRSFFSQSCDLYHLSFEQLDFGETVYLEKFYNADICIVDMTIQVLISHSRMLKPMLLSLLNLDVYDRSDSVVLAGAAGFLVVPYRSSLQYGCARDGHDTV